MTKTMPKTISWLLTGALTMGVTLAHAADTTKVGVLHSLSGTMAISETTLKDTVLMLVDDNNWNPVEGNTYKLVLEVSVSHGGSAISHPRDQDYLSLWVR